MNQPNRRTREKFYQEDIVQRLDDPQAYGVVLRCWHDAEDIPHMPDHIGEPILRPLKHGEVGVSFFATGSPEAPVRDVLSESNLRLVDRMYQPGDLLKVGVEDMRSAVVTSIEVKGRLHHAISGEQLPGWYSVSDTDCYIDIDMGDYVVYNDWIGQVIEMFDEAVVQMEGGTLVRLPELSARLAVGEMGPNILPPPISGMQSLFGYLTGNVRPSNRDTVLSVKRTVLAVTWLAINQSLDPTEAAQRPRPQRFWSGLDLGKLILVRRRAEQAMRVGDRVLLKDQSRNPFTIHGVDGQPPGQIDVRALLVKETKTSVHVLWQDGTREVLEATDTIPYLNPDEYDCWPGDHVIWKNEDVKRAAVVQRVDAYERTAQVRFVDNNTVELASVLELDPHGSNDWSAVSPIEGLGLRRGEFVFIHKEGTTNGLQTPMVPRIGEIEDWVREQAAAQVGESSQLGGWRREMTELGNDIAQRRGKDPTVTEGRIQRPRKDDSSLNWLGEVVELKLDGTADIMLPDSSLIVLPLERLTRLHDGLEQLEELWDDDISDGGGSIGEGFGFDGYGEGDEQVWRMDDGGNWIEDDESQGDWSTDEDDGKEGDRPGDILADVPGSIWPVSISKSPLTLKKSEPGSSSPPEVDTPRARVQTAGDSEREEPDVHMDIVTEPEVETMEGSGCMSEEEDRDIHWKRFEVLANAPVDHAFYSSQPATPSRTFLARLTKEYRALQTSLPETILVRAYEDRIDLLRCLIIGPENTPYEDAPFVIDWMLDGEFPHSPPIAHFLSWTNGNGRVNPNLYEEGKVCLSILGTWAGDKNEIWSASRSSLLQALVSIQGLVLVKEPWFCEPAYEKLRGTEEGTVNSRLYSEKAYVLSRGFVRRALEIPLGSLSDEINWLYYTKGKLAKVVHNARALIDKSRLPSQVDEENRDRAVPRLTGGGIIALDRVLGKLDGLLQGHTNRS